MTCKAADIKNKSCPTLANFQAVGKERHITLIIFAEAVLNGEERVMRNAAADDKNVSLRATLAVL